MDKPCPDMPPIEPRRRRRRDRLLPPMSLVMAAVYAAAAWQVAAEVRDYNRSRAVGGLLVAGMMGGPKPATAGAPTFNERTGLPWLSLPAMPEPSSAADADTQRSPDLEADLPPVPLSELARVSAAADTIAYVWERMLFGVSGVLAAAGLIGLLSRRVRGPHLFAAIVILLSTAGTLVAMHLLVSPQYGAFHPLPLASYLLAAFGQGLYGLVLLLAKGDNPGLMPPCPSA